MSIPYIGITDFTSPDQVRRMYAVFKFLRRHDQQRRLHVGVMMSHRTLVGAETKWSRAFPPKESIADIFSAEPEAMNCLHYADYEGVDVTDSLARAIEFGGKGINALQLDMVWPNPWEVACAVNSSQVELEVILQVGANAITEAGDDPALVVNKLRDYQDVIHYVLLDKSMGRGLGMDAKGLLPFAHAIRKAFPALGIAVAGGLGPTSLDLVKPLLHQFPNVSINARSKLRPSGNALDPIDWDMAEGYINQALSIL